MPLSVQEIYEEASRLPDEQKELLAEQLVASLSAPIDPHLEREHLEIAKRRLADIESGKVSVVDGPSVVAAARRILES